MFKASFRTPDKAFFSSPHPLSFPLYFIYYLFSNRDYTQHSWGGGGDQGHIVNNDLLASVDLTDQSLGQHWGITEVTLKAAGTEP